MPTVLNRDFPETVYQLKETEEELERRMHKDTYDVVLGRRKDILRASG